MHYLFIVVVFTCNTRKEKKVCIKLILSVLVTLYRKALNSRYIEKMYIYTYIHNYSQKSELIFVDCTGKIKIWHSFQSNITHKTFEIFNFQIKFRMHQKCTLSFTSDLNDKWTALP